MKQVFYDSYDDKIASWTTIRITAR